MTLNQWVKGSNPFGVTLNIKHLLIQAGRCFFFRSDIGHNMSIPHLWILFQGFSVGTIKA